MNSLAETNSKKWWCDIKSLAGHDTPGKREWNHQFISDVITSPAELARLKLMYFFTGITQEFEPLIPAQTPPNVVPPDFLVSLEEVSSDLRKLSTQKAVGPDAISNKLLKQFAPELAPLLIQDIYNQSLIEGFVADTLKRAIISPVPKVCPRRNTTSDFRPIALTSCLEKIHTRRIYRQKTFRTGV